MTCTWEADPACLGDAWDLLTDDMKLRSLMLATSSLQMLTYYRVGTCPITIRPLPETQRCGCWRWVSGTPSGPSFWPYVGEDGQWYNKFCGCRLLSRPLSEIDIPGPVGFIDSFKINGEEQTLDNGDWRLDDGHLLVWQGEGTSPVPSVQNLNKPDTEADTWSITYSRSYPVLEDGRLAVTMLAAEFAKACTPKTKCSLPRGVTSVVRNGVSFTVSAGLFPNGLTNIDIVDQFILKWAPAGAPAQTATVFDPAKQRARITSAVPMRSSAGSV
jgi:hypothetical protein